MKAEEIVKHFNKLVPDAKCELIFSSNFELLIAVILSAQCTDKRVNEVTKNLFKIANTPHQFAVMPQEKLERLIYSCGFYHNKAKNIISASKDICERFDGVVPENFEDLVSLAGVGRKTANVMTTVAFHGDAFAVDTHVLRISNRLNLTNSQNPDICERELKNFFDKKDWSRLHYQMVLFGRYKCKSQNPNCDDCPFQKICNYFKEKVRK